jgi:hypothetical protein
MKNEEKAKQLRYGGRKTGKFIRCYRKKELGLDRVEVELHSSLLRGISTLDEFLYLPDIVYPKHLQFVEFDWGRLEQHLSKKPVNESSRILAGAKRRAASLQRVRRYLQKHGVANVHRFLVPMALNKEVSRALDRWAQDFKKGSLWAKAK